MYQSRSSVFSRKTIMFVGLSLLASLPWFMQKPKSSQLVHVYTPVAVQVTSEPPLTPNRLRTVTPDPLWQWPSPQEHDDPPAFAPPPILWPEGAVAYRAVRWISKWDPVTSSWQAVSPDLTTYSVPGDPGYEFDTITAIAHQNGVDYVGTTAGNVCVHLTQGAWRRVSADLPERTVIQAAIDPAVSAGTTAALGYAGYDAATPTTPGHIFVTTDGGRSWTNISGNLPDEPPQSIRFREVKGRTVLLAVVAGTTYEMSAPSHWIPSLIGS